MVMNANEFTEWALGIGIIIFSLLGGAAVVAFVVIGFGGCL